MMVPVRCAVLSALALLISSGRADERTAPVALLHGSAFVRELEKPLNVNRDRVQLREVLERLSDERKIAIVLDRRMDPSRPMHIRLPALTVKDTIDAIAHEAEATMRVVGSTMVVGPEA